MPNRSKLILLTIVAFALTIRAFHHDHLLMSDEANYMLTIKSIIEGDGLRKFFFVHPPIFTLTSSFLSSPFGDNFRLVQLVSIIFSVASFIPIYLIAKRIFDEGTAILSLLVLAFLPLNILYSTWIKPEGMMLFFFCWSLYFYLADQPRKSGVLFAVTLLVKELALFLVPLVLIWEMLKGEKSRSFRRMFEWLMTGLVLSGWWYLFFGATSVSIIYDAFKGTNLFEYTWHYPWYYYLRNLRADLTLVLTPFLIVGMFATKGRLQLLPLCWLLSIYVPLSLIKVKAPWYTFLASPALSIMVAVGLLRAWKLLKISYLRVAMAAIVATLMFVNVVNFNSMGYYQWLIARKLPSIDKEECLNVGERILKKGTRVAILEYNPMLQYYLGISDERLRYLGFQFSARGKVEIDNWVKSREIDFIVIDTNSSIYFEKNLEDLASLYGKPQKVSTVMIYRVS